LIKIPKGRRARREEVENEDEEDQIDRENQEAPFSTVMAKNLIRDPGLDFMNPERRERLTQYYSTKPKVLPSKEVKPLKYNKMDKFASTLEINLNI
jgi:hypothetical protein